VEVEKMKKFNEEITRLVAYVRESTTHDDEWITLKHRESLRISGGSSYAAIKAVEALRFHPNILIKIQSSEQHKLYRYLCVEE